LTATEEENELKCAKNSKLYSIAQHFSLPLIIAIAVLIKPAKEQTGGDVDRMLHRIWSTDCTRRSEI